MTPRPDALAKGAAARKRAKIVTRYAWLVVDGMGVCAAATLRRVAVHELARCNARWPGIRPRMIVRVEYAWPVRLTGRVALPKRRDR